jgi:hypothetical protein
MKWFSLLSVVAILTLAPAAHADDFARTGMAAHAQTGLYDPLSTRSYADFPVYPAGFTSYRGVGFMGYCCEPNPPRTAGLWAGYCDQPCCPPKACGFRLPKLFAGCCPPAPCQDNCCGSPCGGLGAIGWRIDSCGPSLGCCLSGLKEKGGCFMRSLKSACGYGGCNECGSTTPTSSCNTCGNGAAAPAAVPHAAPTPAPQADPAPAPPTPPAPEPVAPGTLQTPAAANPGAAPAPRVSPTDKAAWRQNLRNLPMAY